MKSQPVSQHSRCPYGCSAGHPVCTEGKRLYNRARQIDRQLPQRYPDAPTQQQEQLFDEWHRVAGAYASHIGALKGERYENSHALGKVGSLAKESPTEAKNIPNVCF